MISVLQRKRKSKKGFTLAELLIVVGIIAILVAVAVPVFSGQLTKAEDAVKNANIRSARVEASVHYMMNGYGDTLKKYTFTVTKDGKMTMNENQPENSEEGSPTDTCDKTNDGYTVTVYIKGSEYNNDTIGG